MPKRKLQRYKMRQPDKIRLSRQLDRQLNRRQEELALEETEPSYSEPAATTKKPSSRVSMWSNLVRVAAFFLFLLVFAVAVWVAPHPTHSEVEKRELAKFPKLTVKAFFSGDYFDGINTWFSDTFPGRDGFVKLDAWANRFYRMSDEKLYGTVEQGDEIPDAPTHATEPPTTAATTTATAAATTTTTKAAATTTAPPPPTQKPAPNTTHAPSDHDYWHDGVPENAPLQTLGGILVRGDSAFEYYNFSKGTGDDYARVVSKAAAQLKGTATVYDIIVPTSIGVMLPASVRDGLNSSDQKKASEYLYGSMSADVVTVPIIDVLRSHNDEYLYFHSDHHWTARGAYYAYAEFAKKSGADTPRARRIPRVGV